MKYDFGGWATKNNMRCSDGRTIMKDAFKENDGKTVPLVWNHRHDEPFNVLGHALLENRNEGVYAYCTFNDSEAGEHSKILVQHGDVSSLSIYANQLKQHCGNVLHGAIREVSLVLSGANPGAFIDSVISHGEESDEEAYIYTGEAIEMSVSHSDDGGGGDASDETVGDVFNTMNEKQKTVVYDIVGKLLKSDDNDNDDDEEGDDEMKHNLFSDTQNDQGGVVLSHADEEAIIDLAKSRNVGSFQEALRMYVEDNHLEHAFENVEELFPDYEWTKPGAPEMLTRDQTWINGVLSGVHKSPISRVRMRHSDIRASDIRALGYTKAKEKKLIGSIKLMKRTFDPQTVYVKDQIDRDDIVDITDFDVVAYQKNVMRMALNEELAMAIMVGDGRKDGEEHKIYESHICPIWLDDDLYTIHVDVDIDAAKSELQGSNTGSNFGENYIYAEAIITSALYSREKYKGSGALDFYCTPHLLNVMLLARDLNGRRIYDSKADLAAALNVGNIYTVEQFENKTRKTEDNKVKKLLGLFVNLSDYQLGSTKGGEITNFEDFDIDFNQYKYLMETRVSGALTKAFSAIALEEDVTVTPPTDPTETE